MVKSKSGLFILLTLLLYSNCLTVFAKPVGVNPVQKVTDTFLKAQQFSNKKTIKKAFAENAQKAPSKQFTSAETKEICDSRGNIVAYVTELEPEGYIITSADTDINPILGYSFEGKFPFAESKQNVLLHLVKWDVEARSKALNSGTDTTKKIVTENNESWEQYINNDQDLIQTLSSDSQTTWPNKLWWCPNCGHRQENSGLCENCSTETEERGWIETQWHQRQPYNKFCPEDPRDTGSDVCCDVGCVAVAAGQIINYWKYPPRVQFIDEDDEDRYTSKQYIFGRDGVPGRWDVINIPGDSEHLHFPDFDDLNNHVYDYSNELNEFAYICFATGIKHKMCYSRDGSGQEQSAQAYLNGFAYGSAEKVYDENGIWAKYKSQCVSNIQAKKPVQIGLNRTGQYVGHSVVADGYDASDLFHINTGNNFSWWYNLPDGDKWNWDIITSIVYNITPYKSWSQWGADERNSFRTPYIAPTTNPPASKWQVECPASHYFKGLVVGTGNKIYASCSTKTHGGGPDQSYIWVIDQYGDMKTKKDIPLSGEDEPIGYPVQNTNGDVFVGSESGVIYKIDPVTEAATPFYVEPSGHRFKEILKVDSDGYVYAYTQYTVYCLNSLGIEQWHFTPGGDKFLYGDRVPAIDETLNRTYIPCWDYTNDKAYLYCIGDSGAVLDQREWTGVAQLPLSTSTPSIASDSTAVYVGCNHTLYALNPLNLADELWSVDLSPSMPPNPVAIGHDGTVYASVYKDVGGGDLQPTLKALDPSDGSQKWEYPLAGTGWDHIQSAYVADNSVICFGYNIDNPEGLDTYYTYAIRDCGDHGELLWNIEGGGGIAFGPGATLYCIGKTSPTIHAISEGPSADPDGGGMGYTNNSSPDHPNNPSPTDVSTNIDFSSVTLSWDCNDPNAEQQLKYSIFVGESGYDMVPIATNVDTNSYTIEGLKCNTGYAWKIIATDGQAISESPTWVFATKPPDLNDDGIINFTDFSIFAWHWFFTDCDNFNNWCGGADINHDGIVDGYDLSVIAEHWLEGTESPDISLIAHYKLDETSGAVIDETGNYDGTNHGATTGVSGVDGNAYEFDGVDSYVDTIPQPNIPSVMTMSMWIYPITNENSQIWGSIANASGGKDGFRGNYLADDEYVRFSYYSGNILRCEVATDNNTVPLNTWSYLAFTVDNENNIKIYVNGAEQASGNIGVSPTSHDRALMIGKSILSQHKAFEGIIDDVRVYNRPLLETEIQLLFLEHSLKVGLTSHYKLDETSGAVIDETGNYDGTNHGATTGVSGVDGNAYEFDGVDSYVDTIPQPNIPSVMTMSMWIYPITNENSQIWGSIANASGGKDGFRGNYLADDEYVRFSYYSGNILRCEVATDNNTVPLNTWSYLAFTVDNENNIKIYVNGAEQASGNIGVSPTSHDRALMIGKSILSQHKAFEGIIDDVRVYNRPLLETEIQLLYEN